MKGIFLQSVSKEALLADLMALSPKFFYKNEDNEDMLAQSGDGFALDYIGTLAKPGTGRWDEEGKELAPVEFYDGVHCNVRVFGEMEDIFDGFSTDDTKQLSPATPCRVFA